MFSKADLQELLNAFPSELVHLNIEDSASYTYSDQLIINSSQTGFIRSSSVATELDRLLAESDAESGKLKVEDVAKGLDVAQEYILRLVVHQRTGAALVTRGERFILTSKSRNNLLAQLYQEATDKVVDRREFLTKHDILDATGLDLVSMANDEVPRKSSLRYLDGAHIEPVSKIYSDELHLKVKEILKHKFQEAHIEARVCTINQEDFKGVPILFLQITAKECLAEGSKAEWQGGQLSVDGSVLRYNPESHAKGHATQALRVLGTGERSYVDYSEFESLRAASGSEVSGLLDEVTLLPREQPQWVASKSSLERWRKEARATLSSQGFVLLEFLKFELPRELELLIIAILTNQLTTDLNSVKLNDAVVSQSLFERLLSSLGSAAKIQASEDWKEGADRTLNNDRIHAILKADPGIEPHQLVLVSKILEGEPRDTLVTAYTSATAELAAGTEQEFEVFWTEKVAHRAQLYRLGLDGITESKLREQLGDLLRTYISKELVPEQISKAKTKLLIRGKNSSREAQKLQERLQQATSLPDAFEALEKFHSKQTRRPFPNGSTEKAKETLVLDLQRGMRKDKDNARLFLTLIVVLLAKHNAGVTYATGKYAPKLLKLLKGLIDDIVYQELNELKEKVKSGTITAQDSARMQELATQ